MKYSMTTPCDLCPFLNNTNMRRGFTMRRLREFAAGQFPCHQTANADKRRFRVSRYRQERSLCGCVDIPREKRDQPNQMMRICERLGFYDRTKLDMKAKVR